MIAYRAVYMSADDPQTGEAGNSLAFHWEDDDDAGAQAFALLVENLARVRLVSLQREVYSASRIDLPSMWEGVGSPEEVWIIARDDLGRVDQWSYRGGDPAATMVLIEALVAEAAGLLNWAGSAIGAVVSVGRRVMVRT